MGVVAFLLFLACVGLQAQIEDLKKDINVLIQEIKKIKLKQE